MAATHVIDREGNVWYLCPEYDGGMATRAVTTGPISAGVAWLEREAGPLVPFDPIEYLRAGSCEHSWGPWRATGARYDSLGNYLGPTFLYFSGAGARPVTGGWTRTCRACSTTETSRAPGGDA